MQRSRLKNIISKSKEISKPKEIEKNPFDEFKKSLPKEVGDDYRLEAAWKAYSSPKNYDEAIWLGLIHPVGENDFKLPSIGYNEETDEYEYLNKGEDNEIVAKDIRVWDNDVIPFVKELKQGGFIRLFDEEKDCWVYKKGGKIKVQMADGSGVIEIDTPDADQKAGRKPIAHDKSGKRIYLNGDGKAVYAENPEHEQTEFKKEGGAIDSLQKGGKTEKESKNPDEMPIKAPSSQPSDLVKLIYNSNANFAKRLVDPYRKVLNLGEGEIGTHKLSYATGDGKVFVYPQIQEINGELVDLSSDWKKAWDQAIKNKDYVEFPSVEDADWFTADNYKKYFPGLEKYAPQAFKQGGAVIPSGSLHAHKNHMQLASEGLITPKGIPVVSEEDGKIQQQAEIEREEVIFDKQATTDIEKLYKKFNETDKQSEKDEIAVKAGKILTDIFINNTEDNTGLIEKVADKNNLEYNK